MSDDIFERLKENYPSNPVGCKSDYAKQCVASTRDLKRILVYLGEETFSYYMDLRNNTGVGRTLKDGLLFLTKYKLIIDLKVDGRHFYCLPYKEDIAREKIKLHSAEMNLIRKERKNENGLE
jgi:hypothetical protein